MALTRLQYTPVPGAMTYHLFYRKEGETDFQMVNVSNSNPIYLLNITGLSPGEPYQLYLVAIDPSGADGLPSEIITWRVPLPAPTNLQLIP